MTCVRERLSENEFQNLIAIPSANTIRYPSQMPVETIGTGIWIGGAFQEDPLEAPPAQIVCYQ
ncbi:hypothetical protein RA21_19510 [Leisingera sp. ANG-DT]|nr:hypothetical protein RA21_19510 [Leisingera sp. ANG-DT]